MISQLWSCALTAIGLFGLWLTMRKNIAGLFIAVAAQGLWIAYALATLQFGFIVSAAGYGAVNIYGIRRWLRERQPAS